MSILMNAYKTNLILYGVGIYIVWQEKKAPSAIIAYTSSSLQKDNAPKLSFCMVPVSQKQPYQYKDFLNLIGKAAGVSEVTYMHANGSPRTIYVCRPHEGIVTDIVDRDTIKDCYTDGFQEMSCGNFSFSLAEKLPVKPATGKAYDVRITSGSSYYPQNSIEYAVLNACNACLLGRGLLQKELDIETQEGNKVSFEIRAVRRSIPRYGVLSVTPTEYNGLVSGYDVEPFFLLDGTDSIERRIRLSFDHIAMEYLVEIM